MSRKSKGINAERELVHLFHTIQGWSAVRIAGSGSTKYPSADILAGNSSRHLAIECKSIKEDKKYFEKEEIEKLKIFGSNFGAEIWIAMRFTGKNWYFLSLDRLQDTGKCMLITKNSAESHGLTFEQLLSFSPVETFKN